MAITAPHTTSAPHTPRTPIARNNHMRWGLLGIAAAVAWIPWVGAFLSHGVDRYKNHLDASDEMKLRANYYRNIVAKRLGKDPAAVTVADFQLVAKSDPTFSHVIRDIELKEAEENRESALVNTGVGIAGLVGLGGLAHLGEAATRTAKLGVGALHVAKMGAGQLAGSAVASMFKSNEVSVQEVVERIDSCILDAEDRGINPRSAVTPQLVFLLRVAQDKKFAQEIKTHFGGGKLGFHQMNKEQQLHVMAQFPSLANAVTSEAYSVSTRMMTVQELAASAPNLSSNATKYAVGEQNTTFTAPRGEVSFAERLGNRAPAPSGYMASVEQRRVAAAPSGTEV